MSELLLPQLGGLCNWWSQAITGLVRQQWQLLDAQYRASIELLSAVPGQSAATTALETLERYALERARYAEEVADPEYES